MGINTHIENLMSADEIEILEYLFEDLFFEVRKLQQRVKELEYALENAVVLALCKYLSLEVER